MPHPFDPPPARTPIAVLAIGLLLSGLLAWLAFAESARAALFVLALGAGLAVALSALARRSAAPCGNAAATDAARLRDLVELSSDWFWEQDAAFRFVAMTGSGVNKGNFRIDQALGKTRWELPILGVSEAEWARHRAQLDRHEPFFGFAYQVKVDDGDVRWFSVNGKPVFDAAGAFAGYRGTGHDISAQRNAEAALKESEQRLALAMEAAGAGVWDYDPLEHKTYFSPRFADLLGYPSDEALHAGFSVAQALHPEDRERVLAAQEAALREGHRFDQNYRLLCRDGAYRWFRGVGLDRTDADGRVTHFIGALTDVTAQIEAEQALRDSEARLRKAQAVAQVGSWHVDVPSGRLNWSEETYRIFGIPPGTPLDYELFLGRVHPDDRARVGEAWSRALHGAPYDIEHRIVADDRVRWVREQAELVVDAGGRLLSGIGTVQDISERKRAERQQQLSATVFEHAAEGIVITDVAGNIVSVNRAFCHITGYPAGEVIGKNPRLLQSGRQDAAFYREMWGTLLARGQWRGEIWNRRKNGEDYPELLSICAVPGADGKPDHYIAVFTDISARKQAEQALREFNSELESRVAERTAALIAANRELEAFSYSVSHDLRAPLRAIDGYAHILAEDYSGRLDGAALGHLERIRAAAQRMAVTSDAMLELARLTRTALRREGLDLSLLAASIVEELRGANRHPVEVVIAPGVRAFADRNLTHVVLQNLLHNACKFTARSEPARIEFGTAAEAGETVYFVRDNGAGFDPAHAGKLFGAFQRLHRPDEYAGTGIGLATVQRIVLRHGGRVWAEGAVGAGATFYFTLG
ncbi:MAG: hypothetical protein AMXMBFR31_11670 [Candidatus Desulfobacillus denitrificans]